MMNHPPHAAELLSCIALRNLDRIRQRTRKMLDGNHAAWNRFLDERDDLEASRFEFGTVSFPLLKRGSVDSLCEILKKKYDTTVVPGGFFEMPEHFRVGLGCAEETFAAGIERLGKVLDEIRVL